MILRVAAYKVAMLDIVKKLTLKLAGDDLPIDGSSEIGPFEADWERAR